MTNADNIKNMSYEDLAVYLEHLVAGEREYAGIDCNNSTCIEKHCTKCIENWLKEPKQE